MDILLVISRLLDYPNESLIDDEADLCHSIWSSPLKESTQEKLQQFMWQQLDRNLLDIQSEYDGLFERGRSLGLWLFEHVHGESRDRGQAMVDLLNQYKLAGLEISQKELPDYIPLYLEFLATQGEENARIGLQEVENILALLHARLEKRESHYTVLFSALLELAQTQVDLNEVRTRVAGEARDDTRKALDAAWEEEEITFGNEAATEGCTTTRKPAESQRADLDVPVHWVDFNHNTSDDPQAKRSMK